MDLLYYLRGTLGLAALQPHPPPLQCGAWLEDSVTGEHSWRGGVVVYVACLLGIQLNSGRVNRGRPDTMLCGGGIIYLFGCLRVRMFRKRRRTKIQDGVYSNWSENV